MGVRDRLIDELYGALELAQRKQASDRQPETPDERQLRLQLDYAAQAISALLYVRRATPSVAAPERCRRRRARLRGPLPRTKLAI